jgi:glyoxylase-like metal-dependent hydrolase (beta-lactamase superfamily II)
LIETNEGLVLVDTGFGLEDIRDPHRRLSDFFYYVNNIKLREQETAARQIERLGFKREDVRHILLTHLDFDHAGGITDFPHAKVHLLAEEYRHAMYARTIKDVLRFRPQQWTKPSQWNKYEVGGENWFGFECVRDLEGLPPEILIVPLVGHTFGHSGIAVDTGDGWLLHAGDAYFYRDEMRVENPYCTPGLRAYQTAMEVDRRSRLWNQDRLRALKRDHGNEVRIICAHDHKEFEAARSMGEFLSDETNLTPGLLRRRPQTVDQGLSLH